VRLSRWDNDIRFGASLQIIQHLQTVVYTNFVAVGRKEVAALLKDLYNRQMKIITTSLAGVSLLLTLGLMSCGKSEAKLTAVSSTDSVTYGDVAPIISNRCGICHIGGGTTPELGGYVNLMAHMDEVYKVMEDGSMPPGGPRISTADLQRIRNWIDQGAPQ